MVDRLASAGSHERLYNTKNDVNVQINKKIIRSKEQKVAI
jgi:hypothetical protein